MESEGFVSNEAIVDNRLRPWYDAAPRRSSLSIRRGVMHLGAAFL